MTAIWRRNESDMLFYEYDTYATYFINRSIGIGGLLRLWGRRMLDKYCCACEIYHETRAFYPSRIAYFKAKHEHITTYWYIIHPLSRFKKRWDVLMAFCTLFTISLNFLVDALYERLKDEGFDVTLQIFNWCVILTTLIYIMDMLVNFFHGYIDKERHLEVLEPWKAATRYLKTWFIVDFAVVIDVVLIICSFVKLGRFDMSYHYLDYQNFHQAITTENIIKHYRLVRFFRLISVFKTSLTCRYWFLNYPRYLLSCVLVIDFLFVHCFACMFVIVDQYDPEDDKAAYNASWLHFIEEAYSNTDSQINGFKLYLHCLLEMVKKLNLFENISNIRPVSYREKIFETIAIATGYVLQICSFACLMFVSESDDHMIYTNYANEMDKLLCWLRKEKHTPLELRKRVIENFKVRDARLIKQYFLKRLPPRLHAEVVSQLWGSDLFKSAIFAKMPRELVDIMLKSLKQDIFMPDQVVFKAGQTLDRVYFICSGQLALYDTKMEEQGHAGPKSILGGELIKYGAKYYLFTAVATEYIQALWFSKNDFASNARNSAIFRRYMLNIGGVFREYLPSHTRKPHFTSAWKYFKN